MKNRMRLHHAISKNLELRAHYTGANIQANIPEYGVLIDGVLSKKRLDWVIPTQTLSLNNWPAREIPPLDQVKIIDEQPDFVVLYKPAGVVVHPGAGHTENTLFDWILEHIEGQKQLMEEAGEKDNAKLSAGLVHRLDKNTSGLILVAKTLAAHTRLQDLFRERKVEKHYLAVLKGNLQTVRQIMGYQMRDKKNPLQQKFFEDEREALHYSPLARMSHSIFTPLQYNGKSDQTLVDVEIKTGRMHQIRVHARFLRTPVLNDTLYNKGTQQYCTFEIVREYIPKDAMQLLSNSLSFEGYTVTLIKQK